MANSGLTESIRAGDIDGLGRVYSEFGGLILRSTETSLAERDGCDVAIYGSWRIFFSKPVFHPLPGKPSGTIHITSERLIFLRNIDVWKEVKPLLTPLGIPSAVGKEANLKRLEAKGARQYCEVFLPQFRLIRVKRKPWFVRFRLMSKDGGKYEIFLRADKDDSAFFDFLVNAVKEQAGSH